MLLPSNFLEKEMRCGFIVSEKRKKIWAIQLELLEKFDEFCKEYGLKYYVFYGALLGAVRHKGFIPWDDDIDVVMLRKDYDKLCEIGPKIFKYPYYFQSPNNADNNLYYTGASLIHEETTYLDTTVKNNVSNHWGIQLDIATLDNVPNNIKMRHRQYKQMKLFSMLYSIHMRKWNSFRFFGKIMKIPCMIFFTLFPVSKAPIYIEQIKRKYHHETCFMIGDCSHGLQFYKNDFEGIVYLDFEYIRIPVPSGYKRILMMLYGNYMDFPSPEQQFISEALLNGYISEPDISYTAYKKIIETHAVSNKVTAQKRQNNYVKNYPEE